MCQQALHMRQRRFSDTGRSLQAGCYKVPVTTFFVCGIYFAVRMRYTEKNRREGFLMSRISGKIVPIIGIIVGVAIIILGVSLQDTERYAVGESIKFGADFYTEIYDVTKDVGHVINYVVNDLIRAIGWLIISLGAMDICFFAYKLVNTEAMQEEIIRIKAQTVTISNNLQVLANPVLAEAAEEKRRAAEEKAKREAEEKAKREAEEKAKREAERQAKWEAEEKAKPVAEEKAKPVVEEKTKPVAVKKEMTLAEKLAYALKFQTDDGMVRYLKDIQDETVQNILQSPQDSIRGQIESLLEKK